MNHESSTYDIIYTCPICKQHRIANLNDPNKILNASRYPVSIVDVHGEPKHAVTLFIDQHFKIRAVQPSDVLSTLDELKEKEVLTERYIPIPMPKKVKISDLSKEELIVVSLSDGKRDLQHICQVLDISMLKGKLLAEKLVRLKRLKELKREYSVK